ncbi:DUF445 domain-containing protein [Neokomagataea thailandica]|uniref:DUF445 domain-containing protein n=1 Tax=Neokomagataea tanensis NBRC 106556 TaxID=1223519 RepID=A0ABQ0QKK2_9PROT|nr:MULTISPECIES: DUF445 domain-containing protein [Neokomagataea]GBR48116.1 hypothetical protein AA106556_1694 [Neokomagataea tanensis NBRC 106556]
METSRLSAVKPLSQEGGVSPKRKAEALLVIMGVASGLTTWLSTRAAGEHHFWLDTLRAGTRSGVVGGLADWFAVTALFRHPLGIPIPHTAILPRQKDRLGRALGRFVGDQLFADDEIRRVLRKVDVPGLVAKVLEDPQTRESLIFAMQGSLPDLFARIEDGRAGTAMANIMAVALNGEEMAPLVARVLRAMVESEMHQEVISFLISKLQEALAAREDELRDFVEDRVREQGGRFVGWALGSSVASRVFQSLQTEIERIDPMDSALRQGFTRWVCREIEKLECGEGYHNEFVKGVSSVLQHDVLRAWCQELWLKFRRMAEDDSRRTDGWSAAVLASSVDGLASLLRSNEGIRQKANTLIERGVFAFLPQLREKMKTFMMSVIARWDGEALSAQLEAGVGRDLAYVRVNGTVVGFLVGAVLEGVFRVVAGL